MPNLRSLKTWLLNFPSTLGSTIILLSWSILTGSSDHSSHPQVFPSFSTGSRKDSFGCMSIIEAPTIFPTMLVSMAIAGLTLQNKLRKVCFFQNSFCWLTLAWFFTFSSADIQFGFGWLTQIQTTKRVELLNGGSKDNLWLGLGSQEYPRHDLRRVFGLPQYFGINNYPIDLAFQVTRWHSEIVHP